MKYKATKKFKDLGIENSYQGLATIDYFNLRAGAAVELSECPQRLIDNKYLETVPGIHKKVKGE